jgi:hypothetical protein
MPSYHYASGGINNVTVTGVVFKDGPDSKRQSSGVHIKTGAYPPSRGK